MSQDLLYVLRDGIGRITFNRPQARNALTFEMYERLAEVIRDAQKDSSVKALILTGAGSKPSPRERTSPNSAHFPLPTTR